MKAREAAKDIQGREISLYYNPALRTAVIEYGRAYQDEAEADFMGDEVPLGAPNGYVFCGVTLFHSSNGDSSCVGCVEATDSDEKRFGLEISGPLGATVSFQFDTFLQTKAE